MLKRSRILPTGMGDTDSHFIPGIAILVTMLLLLLSCAPETSTHFEKASDNGRNFYQALQALERRIQENPCGFLQVRQPLLQVSGFLTASPRDNTSLVLFIAPNTSFDAALYVVEHCPPIYRSSSTNAKRFTLPPLPEGNYVVMLDGHSFGSAQGFPVVNEINDSDWIVDFAFHGGNSQYSMAAFSIHPKDRAVAEHSGGLGEGE